MIKIVDYGLGNIQAFLNVYKQQNILASIAKTASDLKEASHIILPGVGSFDHAMILLQKSGMRETLDELVLEKGIPVLGICVGMQILANSSEEGKLKGLGWISGSVRKLKANKDQPELRLPHMGWNDINILKKSEIFTTLEKARFYFLHSYYFECESQDSALAETDCGVPFVCAVHSKNIFGVQFHPEKSHQYGTLLLKNFSGI